MNNRCYILTAAQVSCQQPLSEEWIEHPILHEEQYVRAAEPDSRQFIAPADARRMSRILKRTVCTSLSALNNAGISDPDAIITGTGMGCMENSEKFLIDLGRYGENCLKPTLFMQSTHNTISSLIAITLKCHGYNNTYSHKGISFESALFDAWLQIRSAHINNALVGAHDEVTPFMARVLRKTHPEYSSVTEASVAAVLGNKDENNALCEIEDVRILHNAPPSEIASLLPADSESALLLGVNGNELNDRPYLEIINTLSAKPLLLQYKNIFGENFSDSAIAFYAAAQILNAGHYPEEMLYAPTASAQTKCNEKLKRITILNHSDGSWGVVQLVKT